jgi:hypothetical protein
MDKLGPITRSAEDCAIVLAAIHGPDGKDISVAAASFTWNPLLDWRKLRIGYLKSEFDAPSVPKPSEPPSDETTEQKKGREKHEAEQTAARTRREYDRRYDLAALEKLRAMGINLMPVELPKLPYGAMVPLLTAEAAAAFDDLTLSGRDRLLTEQGIEDCPTTSGSPVSIPQSSTSRPIVPARSPFNRSQHFFTMSTSSSRQQRAGSYWRQTSLVILQSSCPMDCEALMLPGRQKSTTAIMTTSVVPEHRFRSRSWQVTTTTPN